MKIRFIFSPFFINKLYIYRETKKIASRYKFKGKIIDIGCGVKPYKGLFQDAEDYLGIDFRDYSENSAFNFDKPDYFFDKNYSKKHTLPFKKESYDNAFAFQVLEHHPDPKKLIGEMTRITKKGGYIFLTVPFLGGIHEEPNDFQRYTKYGLTRLLSINNLKIVELSSYGSIFSTISCLLNEGLCNYVNKGKLKYAIGAIIFPPFLLFQYLSVILDYIFKSDQIVRGYLVLAKK